MVSGQMVPRTEDGPISPGFPGGGDKFTDFFIILFHDLIQLIVLLLIQPVHPKGDQSRVFIGRTYAETEAPIFWPPDAKN